jgi:DNA-directed RNA polymerase specialized sigma24 family protein
MRQCCSRHATTPTPSRSTTAGTPLLGYLVRRTGDPELGADLTAETFASALEGVDRFDPARGSAVNWLFGIARHQLPESETTAARLNDALETLPALQREALSAHDGRRRDRVRAPRLPQPRARRLLPDG